MQDRQELLREIKEKNEIVSVISEYTTLKRSGRGLVGLCPFHGEKTPSFNVNSSKQVYYCFGCGKGGDVISFVMQAENLDFIGAAKRLAKRAGIDWPEYEPVTAEERKKAELYKITQFAAAFFHQCLIKTEYGAAARRYLEERMIHPQTMEHFVLGYAPAGWHHLTEVMRQKQISLEVAESIGLVGLGENGFYDRFRDRIMFPITDPRGKIVGFGGRVCDNSQPKYLNSPDSLLFHKSNFLYGLHPGLDTIRKKRQVIMVEGYFDVIQAHQAGFTQTIASLGTALTKEQVKMIKRYADEVVLAYDGDPAGEAATQKGIELFTEAGMTITVVHFPAGEDPDSFIKKTKAAGFQDLLEHRMQLVDYKIEKAIRSHDLQSPENKAEAVREVLPQIAEVRDHIAREAYIRKISREIGVSETAIFTELRQWLRNNGRNSQVLDRMNNNSYTNEINPPKQLGGEAPEVGKLNPLQKAIFEVEKELLQISLQEYDKFERIKEELEPEDFRFSIWRELFIALENGKASVEPSRMVVDELASSQREVAASLLAEKEVRDQPEDLSGILHRLKMLHVQEQIEELTQEITTGRDSGGVALTESDLKEKIMAFTELKRRLQKEFPRFSAEI